MSWISWLSCVTMPPIEVQATLQYASTYLPSLTHTLNGAPVLTHLGLACATIIMLLLSIINVASFKGLVRFNSLLFTFKIFVILFTIYALTTTHFHAANFTGLLPTLSHTTISNHWEAILTAVASGGVAFAFTGFTHGIALAGETKRSQFAIPLAVIGSVVVCLLLYLGLQIAFIGAIDPSNLIHGWKNLSFSGDVGPFIGIASILGIGLLVKLLYIDTVVSPLGAGFIYVTSTARTVYAMSKNGYFPPFIATLNEKGFPIYAIVLNFVLGMLLFLPLPGWQAMVSFLVSAVVISYAIGPISLICLRLQLPAEKRPFHLPGANLISLLAFYCCNLISYWTGWDTIWKLAVAIGIGIVVLMFAYFKGLINKNDFGSRSLIWLAPYLFGLFFISYLGSFGGKRYIPFGWDFLVIALFSIFILILAVISRQSSAVLQFKVFQRELEVTQKTEFWNKKLV